MNDFRAHQPPREPFQFRQNEHDLRAVGCCKFKRRRCCARSSSSFFANSAGPGADGDHARRPKVRRLLANRRAGRVAAAALTCAAVWLPVSLVTSPSATAAQP